MYLPSQLARMARRHPHKPAAVCLEQSLTFARLHQQARGLAAGLRRLGLKRGQAVGIMMPGCAHYPACLAAPLLLGAVSVPLDPRMTPETLASIRDQCRLALVLASPLAPRLPGPRTVTAGNDLEQLLHTEARNERFPEPAGEDHAIYVFTSGTTGRPKGVVLTHENIARRGQNRRRLDVTVRDSCYTVGGLFHNGKLFIGLIWSLYLGMTFHTAGSFSPARVLRHLARYEVTLLHASPMHFAILAATAETEQAPALPALRLCISSGNRLEPAVARAFEQQFGVPVHENYGITEAGGICTDGVPLEDVRIRITGEGGEDLEPGEVGRIVVSGPGMAHGYLGGGATGGRGFDGDWFHTGDLGRLDQGGRLQVHCRAKGAVQIGGELVYPELARRALLEHPGVSDARVSRGAGDWLVARVVPARPRPTAEVLLAHCRQRLRPAQVPREITFQERLLPTWREAMDRGDLDRLS